MKTYKKTINFGKVKYNPEQLMASNLVSLDLELQIKDNNQIVFTASGNVWNSRHTDCEMGGQCLDDIWKDYATELENPTLYKQILGLWKRNHLNDMHHDCIHQRKNWKHKDIELAHLKINWDTVGKQRHNIEARYKKDIETKRTAKITIPEQRLLNLKYFITVDASQVAKYPEYVVDKLETKSNNWVSQSEHPEGLLSKPCEVCGYKYGSAWVYDSMSTEDLRAICKLLDIDPQTANQIIKNNQEVK